MDGEEAGDREMVALIGVRSFFASSFHQLVHILGDFVIGDFGINLCAADI